MPNEQLANQPNHEPTGYIDRLRLRIFTPSGANHPTTNIADLMDFIQRYSDCEIEFVDMTDEGGTTSAYAVATPRSPEYMI